MCDLCDPADPNRDPRFCDWKRLRIHAKSHRMRLCPLCYRMFSENGRTQHLDVCTGNPDAGLAELLPVAAMADRIGDFLDHAETLPPTGVLVMSVFGDAPPAFLRHADAGRIVGQAQTAVLAIPAVQLPSIQQANRLRRRTDDDRIARADRPRARRRAVPLLGGSDAWGDTAA